jgi:putative endonuclease
LESGRSGSLLHKSNKKLLFVFSVYILKNSITNKYYIGQTSDIEKRLLNHNSGYSKSTKSGMPWKLVYSENFNTRQQALKRETELKKYKSRIMLDKIISD